MGRKKKGAGYRSLADYAVLINGRQIMIEINGKEEKNNLVRRLQMFSDLAEDLFYNKPDEHGYRKICGYRVREIFAGEESLTSLLTQYMERMVAVHY